jgi:hypothetical protein
LPYLVRALPFTFSVVSHPSSSPSLSSSSMRYSIDEIDATTSSQMQLALDLLNFFIPSSGPRYAIHIVFLCFYLCSVICLLRKFIIS